MRSRIVVLVLGAVLFALAAGLLIRRQLRVRRLERVRTQEAVERAVSAAFQPKYRAAGERIRTIVANLPDPAAIRITAETKELDPAPTCSKRGGNVEVIDYRTALDPTWDPFRPKRAATTAATTGRSTTGADEWANEVLARRPESDPAEFRLCSTRAGLVEAIRQSAGGSYHPQSVAYEPTADQLRGSYQRPLDDRYLLVFRTVTYVKPMSTGESSFRSGRVEGVVYLVDLSDGSLIASCPVLATNHDRVKYVDGTGPAHSDREEELYYDLSDATLEAACKALQRVVGLAGPVD